MTTPTRQTLREWTRNLTLDEIDPYAPTETRYVPLKESGRGAVDELQATIELAIDTTTQLLSGPTGSGKSTELLRLRGGLREQGYLVTVVNMKDYVNTSSPIDVTEFLIALALAAYETYGVPAGVPKPSFAARLGGLLKRLKLDVDVAGVKLGASAEGVSVGAFGSSAEFSLKSELKSSQPFVEELRSRLAFHVGELYEDVAAFLAELSATASAGTDPTGAVLIVDGLEKLQGVSTNDREVQESIERLFVTHASKLKFASHHLVYTVPTYLLFTNPGALPYSSRVLPVPIPYVAPRKSAETEMSASVAQTRQQLRDVVQRRIPVDEVFGHDLNQLETVISASGGHLRDLFTIITQLLNQILRRSLSLPLGADQIDEAIRDAAYSFGSATQEQLEFLERVNVSLDGTVVPAADEVGMMARLLQGHMLLSHLNGSDWYEVHPLARRALRLG